MPSAFVEQYQRVLGHDGKAAGSEWTFYCPFPGCAGYRRMKFYVNQQTGAWQCKHCNEIVPHKDYRTDCRDPHGGSWKEFVWMMGDEASLELWPRGPVDGNYQRPEPLGPKKRREVWGTLFGLSSLLPRHEQLIRDRGLDPIDLGVVSSTKKVWRKLIRIYGEELCIRAGIARLDWQDELQPTLCVQPGRILIPFWEGEEISYFVGYMKQSDTKYAGPTGYDSQVYGDIPEDCELLIITEGQLKAAAAIHIGYACIGLQGMGSKHRKIAGVCAKKRVKRVVIMFDTQPESQDLIDYDAERLARELLKRGIQVYYSRLPLEPGETKTDIDSFLLRHSPGEFEQVLIEAMHHPYLLESQAKELQKAPDGQPTDVRRDDRAIPDRSRRPRNPDPGSYSSGAVAAYG